MKDYSKIKALAQSIIECIGDECEGENPDLPDPKRGPQDNPKSFGARHPGPQEYESQGDQEPLTDMSPAAEDDTHLPSRLDQANTPEDKKRKKRNDDVVALFASTLASKFNK